MYCSHEGYEERDGKDRLKSTDGKIMLYYIFSNRLCFRTRSKLPSKYILFISLCLLCVFKTPTCFRHVRPSSVVFHIKGKMCNSYIIVLILIIIINYIYPSRVLYTAETSITMKFTHTHTHTHTHTLIHIYIF
jgi:hypothetical protein